ncbi:hypothetical protein L211DRAFT_850528 [Terfezia boudieri ATCC MYA-4762]|uniref:Uncharacterized protein n=1 Tax=Terfezia boudieri ATCC MYA-4762 TaxID=1051890 RepID=A0A3N4LMC1_9PEZI|nr:hypothetical protein L211DRAFT_850528 [Terfezia boudieri ATCC MYA-4762]
MWLQPHMSSSYLKETRTILTTETELLCHSNLRRENILKTSTGMSVTVNKGCGCNVNHTHTADNDHYHSVIFGSVFPTNIPSQLHNTENPARHAVEQYLKPFANIKHPIVKPLSHKWSPTLRIHMPVDLSYSMSQSLNICREDPWTSQNLRFQNQHILAGQQQSNSLIRFLGGNSDDPWTPECLDMVAPRVVERQLLEMECLWYFYELNVHQ